MATSESDPLAVLTPRDLEFLQLILAGKNNREIADQLNLAYQTVRNRVSGMYRKAGVGNRVGLTLWAVDSGLHLKKGGDAT